ncbi:AMP-binding protein [Novosphingobium lentum]|uniref:AMP-binding protein n=1 Tax=Novosphingobium lentum TaxID=145287 RepID=UPI000831DD92|nr:AMP-binding protein [Novosphingobium lentum]
MSQANLLIVANLVADRAASQPDHDVLTFEHEGEVETLTYRQLWENGQRLANGLRGLGMAQGDRFALLIQNHPEFVELMVASAILGTVFVPIDPRTRGAKLAYMLRDSGCRGVICAGYSREGLAEALPECPEVEWIALIGELGDRALPRPAYALGDWLAAPLPDPLLPVTVASEAEPMQLMYTSGTTGDPKGIVVPHARFGAVSNHGEAVFGYRPDDRPYTGLSLTHGNAQFVTLAPSLKMGLRVVFSRRFTKSRLWEVIRAHGCTTFSLLGGMVTAIYAEPPKPDDAENPVRLVISAGMPAAIWEAFERRFGVAVFEFYGAMEGGMTIKRVGEGPVGSCGRPAPGLEVKVVDADDVEVAPGEPGELLFRLSDAPFPPVSYHNNPSASAAKVVDGWLRSGDIVHRDADGWIFYQYRKGGGLRRNGEFVNPAHVERVLAEHPAVDDIFVYGVPAANGAPGEKDIVAAAVLASPIDPAELLGWAASRLEPNAVPTYVQVVPAIPKTASEKPQERFLIAMFQDRAAPVHTIEGARP